MVLRKTVHKAGIWTVQSWGTFLELASSARNDIHQAFLSPLKCKEEKRRIYLQLQHIVLQPSFSLFELY